jgi:hypothetical protein
MELREEHSATGGPIECTADELVELANGLREWLLHEKLFDWQAGTKVESRLVVCLCRDDDIITTRDKPALAVEYSSSFFFARWKYVVDRTCLDEPEAELRAFVAALG